MGTVVRVDVVSEVAEAAIRPVPPGGNGRQGGKKDVAAA